MAQGDAQMGKGTLHQMIARGAFVLSGYAVNILMVYLLGNPVLYGVFGTMTNITNIARVLLSTGLPQATSKFIADNDERLSYPILRTSMKLQWILGAAIVAVYVAGTPVWTRVLSDPSMTPYFWVTAPLIPLMGAFQVLQGYFNGRRRFVAQAWMNILYSVGRVVFAVALAALLAAGLRVYGALGGYSIALVVAIVVSWMYVRPKSGAENTESRRLMAFALPLMVLAVGQAVLVNLDLLMLKSYFPSADIVGYYSGATNLGRSPYFLFTAFSMTMLPVVAAALAKGEERRAGELVARNLTFLLVGLLPVVAIIAAVPGPLLDFVYPAAYTVADKALVWQTVAQCLLAIVAALTAAITAKGRPYVAMGVWLVCIPVQLGAGMWLVPRYGMAGAAIASLIACVVGTVAGGTVTLRLFGALIEPVRVLKAAAVAVVVYVLMTLPPSYPMWLLPFACFAALGVYGGLMLAVRGITVDEVRSLLEREKLGGPGPVDEPLGPDAPDQV